MLPFVATTGSSPAVAEVVRRVTAEASARAPAAEQELERWADEGGFVPLLTETAGFEAYYLADAGEWSGYFHQPFWRSSLRHAAHGRVRG